MNSDKKRAISFVDLHVYGGLLLLVVGCGLVHPALALICGGLALMLLGLFG